MKKETLARLFAYPALAGMVYFTAPEIAADIDWENRPVNADDRLIETVKALRNGTKESRIGDPLPQEEAEHMLLYYDMG
ncbi:MAG: hypothetical protein ACLFR0_03425 [Alphaproteobacteria bacterium]